MSHLENLKNKQKTLKSALTRFNTFLTKTQFSDDETFIQLRDRLYKIEPLLDQFIEIQNEIASLEDIDANDEIVDFENKFYSYTARAKKILKTNDFTDSVNSVQRSNLSVIDDDDAEQHSVLENSVCNNNNDSQLLNEVKLPVINLPIFSGKQDEWPMFCDTFISLIHNNSTLAPVQKFHYLRLSLKGEAAGVIESLEISNDSYDTAFQLLRERFENKRLLVHKHIKSLLELPSVPKESHSLMRQFSDALAKHIRALKVLKMPVEQWSTLLIQIVVSKLDNNTKREWEITQSNDNFPNIDEFQEFIKRRCQLLQALDADNTLSKIIKQTKSLAVTTNSQCAYCSENHSIQNCSSFLKLPINARITAAKAKKLCLNCLRSNHFIKNCKSSNCRKCSQKHHTLLHRDQTEINQKDVKPDSSKDSKTLETEASVPSSTVVNNHSMQNSNNYTLLSTAIIEIVDQHGKVHCARALLDSGSQSNFVTQELCDKLKLKKRKINYTVSGINSSVSNIKESTEINIRSRLNAFTATLSCLVLKKITEEIPYFTVNSSIRLPDHITLADPSYNIRGKIDILIGAPLFWSLICVGQVKLGDNLPTLQNTKFGWLVSGSLPLVNNVRDNSTISNCAIDMQLAKFWEVEEFSNTPVLSPEEKFCEENFTRTTERDETGHFIVKIPFKETVLTRLGDSYQNALNRFNSLEKRFFKNPQLKREYHAFMQEYITLGHMTKVSECNKDCLNYYLPHHAVFKHDSSTTKIRVVFDGSSKSDSGISLNDTQMVGPVIQNDLFSILLRFRTHTFVFVADVAKMYRQVLIHPSQRKFQQILWRFDANDSLDTYELNTVTYGTASASFLAIRSLQQTAVEFASRFPAASNAIINDMYLDDLLTGASSVEEAKELAQSIISILKTGGFDLRKFISNDKAILEHLPSDTVESKFINIEHSDAAKTLGLIWVPVEDTLKYSLKINKCKEIVTKRSILSEASKVFDPLGLVGPVIMTVKLILQELWQAKVSWDEPVPLAIHTKWLNFRKHSNEILNISIPRHVTLRSYTRLELHGFSDASVKGYGACVYLKTIDNSQNTQVSLFCAKGKVAPLKTLTIPRLELCGALLLARLVKKVIENINVNINEVHYWCDSTITLSWINTSPNRLKLFVANRVQEIKTITNPSSWHHVSSNDNPADLISRGVSPKELQDCSLWWNGPDYLLYNNYCYPSFNNTIAEIDLPETHTTVTLALNLDFDIFDKYSSFLRLQRIIAYILRFRHNSKVPKQRRNFGNLTPDELQLSLLCMIKLCQAQAFFQEINDINKKKPISVKSKLLPLHPFLDKDQVLRVGGRLSKSLLHTRTKHPIVLPSNHKFTKLLVAYEHVRLLHAGPQLLLSSVRETYWPIAGRNLVRKVVKDCITCFRVNPTPPCYLMGDLPSCRVTPARPFVNSGLDYAGPILIKDRKTRGCKIIKSYICIFICMSTKAIHLELVSELTTECFLAALRRFVSRRGKCQTIWSDNGTTFVGANSELKNIISLLTKEQNLIENSLSKEGIIWKFIPPKAPHFGGIWERGVRSIKFHLKRVIGEAYLTYEELYTVLVQIESCLNSRPLTPLSSDPHDLHPLTPAHFLIGETLTALPDHNLMEVKENRLSRFQRLQKIIQQFWKRWSSEFLTELQTRSKWQRPGVDVLKPGVLVIIKEDGLPPLKWRMGRVIDVHPGTDGIVRAATIKTSVGQLKRPAAKLCVLPIDGA